jgi:hypothetical protein
MNSSVNINSFDKGKPFYPLIMNYLILLIGFKHIAVQGAINDIDKYSGINTKPNFNAITNDFLEGLLNRGFYSEHNRKELERNIAELSNGLTNVLGPLELKSEFQSHPIKVEIEDIANDVLYNGPYLLRFIMHSAGSLIIFAHELSKGKSWHD